MKIRSVRCAVLGSSPIVRITTDEGIDGYGQIESDFFPDNLVALCHHVLLGQDPTDIERCMLRIRRFGGFKPWGRVISAIEVALHDVTGKFFGVPAHKLLGGKVRDRVRVYNGGVRPGPDGSREDYETRGTTPEDYRRRMAAMRAAPQGFTIIKESLGFHDFTFANEPRFLFNDLRHGPMHPNRGPLTERGLQHVIDCAAAMKEVLGDQVALALDMGPGWTISDAIRIMRAIEPLNVLWAEDVLTGNYIPWVHPADYAELTRATSTPTHTGEQIYLRENFRELLSSQAVRVIGPDMLDVGGMAELKRIAELADLYGVQVAPHGVAAGLIGLAGLIQVCAAMPDNFIAFEYPVPIEPWWYDVVVGLPDQIVVDGFVEVIERPGLGIDIDRDLASAHLRAQDAGFFD